MTKTVTESSRPRRVASLNWMHPSCRDLVIDMLQNDGPARRQFLRSSSLNGVALALSRHGGESGERAFPLLKTCDDWHVLSERMVELISTADAVDASSILQVLDEASEQRDDNALINNDQALGIVICEVLKACRDKWNAGRYVISLPLLTGYYRVSERMRPLYHGPDLSFTWEFLAAAAQKCLTELPHSLDTGIRSMSEFLRFVALVRDNEPRLLRQNRFPENFVAGAQKLLDAANLTITDEFDADEKEEYEDEINRLVDLQSLIRNVERVFPSLREAAKRLREKLSERESDVQAEMEDKYEDSHDEIQESNSDNDDRFDIAAVFSDL